MASSSPGFWLWVFFPAPLVFLGRGVLSSSSRMTNSGVWSHLRFLAFGLSALLGRGSSSDGSVGGCFPRTFSQCFEPELEALLEGCETRLAGACFRRLRLNPHGHPKKVRALWTSSGASLPVCTPPHILFLLPRPPRITKRLVWPIGVISSRSLELFLPLWKGDGWILSESWTKPVCSGKWVRL